MESSTVAAPVRASFLDLARTFHQLDARVKRARAAAARRDIDYAATPDGLAEAQRRLDLAATWHERQQAHRLVQAGVRAAAAEFRQRALKDAPVAGDGYLFPLPLSAHTPAAVELLRAGVMGTWRIQSTGDATVQLLTVAAGERHRCTFELVRPSSDGITLPGAIRAALTSSDTTKKLTRLLGASFPNIAAHLQENADV